MIDDVWRGRQEQDCSEQETFMRGATLQKLVISMAVVGVYAAIPLLGGVPRGVPALFKSLLAGVPLSVWLVVALLLGLPLVAGLCTHLMSDGGAEPTSNRTERD
jgi:hypothetical protein